MLSTVRVVPLDGDGPAHIAHARTVVRSALAEDLPLDPGLTDGEFAGWTYRAPATAKEAFLALDGDEIVGYADLRMAQPHPTTALGRLFIAPRARRRGIGHLLFDTIEDAAHGAGVPRLVTSAVDNDASAALARAVNAERGTALVRHRLDLRHVDVARLRENCRASAGSKYELVRWTNSCPDDLLVDAARIRSSVVTTPVGTPDSFSVTPGKLRWFEETFAALGQSTYVLAVRDRDSGQLAAINETIAWDGVRGEGANVVVAPDHRGKSLARWMLSEMVLWLLDAAPSLQDVIGHAVRSNTAMLATCHQVGYVVAGSLVEYNTSVRRP